MAKKESVLSQAEKDSFVIDKFIFHIIVQEDVKPIYLDEIELTEEQIRFFKARFGDVSEGVQHIFTDKSNSNFFDDCSTLIEDPEKNFLDISKKLTASFKEHHLKSTNDGVFITSLVKVLEDRYLIFLLKLDHRKVYEYVLKGTKALLHEVTKTFVEDRKAIQKSALVDISDHYSWDVLATDRTANGKTALRNYFANFLTVVEKETPSTLTKKAVTTIRQWAIQNKALLDPDQDVSTYKTRGVDYLNSTSRFNSEDYLNAVIQDVDDERSIRLKTSFKNYCDEVGLSGQSFIPNKGSLDKATRKSVRETAEGVRIEWEGDALERNIDIPQTPDINDGLYHIVIKTSNLEILDK